MLVPRQRFKLARGTKDKEHAMSEKLNTAIAVIGIDIGKNSFHVVGHDQRGAIVLHQKWSRGQVPAEVCERMKRDGGSVFPAHANTDDPNGPLEAFPLMRSHAR